MFILHSHPGIAIIAANGEIRVGIQQRASASPGLFLNMKTQPYRSILAVFHTKVKAEAGFVKDAGVITACDKEIIGTILALIVRPAIKNISLILFYSCQASVIKVRR
jgi:hypothetical protein